MESSQQGKSDFLITGQKIGWEKGNGVLLKFKSTTSSRDPLIDDTAPVNKQYGYTVYLLA